ncbi:hypothetical protein ACWGE0_38700 [Lentzea sp. NPDC054927]
MFTREQGARAVRRVAGLAVATAFAASALITGVAVAQAAPASTSDIEGLFNLAGWGWNNRAGSLTTAHQCDVRLFDAADCPNSGLKSTWIDRSEDLRLGGVNWQNKATCVQIS